MNFPRVRASGASSSRTKNSLNAKPQNVLSVPNDIPHYQITKVLGRGAFGIVCCAKSPSGETVAVKKVKIDPTHKNREIDILKLLKHKNCISLQNSFKTTGSKPGIRYINIVMDYLPMSLHKFAYSYKKNQKYPPIFYVKLFSYQLFTGLSYIHSIGVTHRDIKPENVIIDPATGELKICDFGSAKMLHPNEESIAYIASRFYRAPELILGSTHYTTAIDIWAAGCVIVELLNGGSPLFPGKTSKSQLTEIVSVIGRPTKDDLNSFSHPNVYINGHQTTTIERSLPKHVPADILDLLSKIFVYNPKERYTAEQCMRHSCFDELFNCQNKMPNGNMMPILENPPEL